MNALLTREQQIELMRTAQERIENRVRSWISQPQINEAMRLTQNDLQDRKLYSVTPMQLRRSA
jgi:hypothetical protein